MKAKTLKIVTLVLSFALILGLAIGISASADENAPSLKIISKNLSYGGTISIAFAVDAQNVGDSAVSLLVYDSEPKTETEAPKYTVSESLKNQNVHGVNAQVFFTQGIAVKDMPDVIYVRAAVTVNGTTTYSELERYSVAEYAYDVQYRSELGEDFVEIGKYLIALGGKIQTVLPHDKDNKPSDFLYAAVDEGTLDGKYNSGLYKEGDKVTLKYVGTDTFIGWDVKYIDAAGKVTTALVADNTTITLDKHLVAKPASAVATFEDGSTKAPNVSYGSQGTFNVVADPRNSAGKVLNVVTNDGSVTSGDNASMSVSNMGKMASDELYAAFDGDFYIQNNGNYSNWAMQINFLNKSTGDWMYALWFMGSNNGTKMYVRNYHDSSVVVADTAAFASNWFNLRLVYHVNGAESTLSVYVNGQCLAKDVVACHTDRGSRNTLPISRVDVRFRKNDYVFYADNLSLTTSAKDPGAPEFKRDTFDSSAVPSYITVPANSTKVEIAADPTNSANKVLSFVQASANSPRPTFNTSITAPYFTFASDVYIERGTKTGTLNELFFSGNGGDAFRLKIQYVDNQIRLRKWTKTDGTTEKTEDFATPIVLEQDKWFNLRFDYYLNGTDSYLNIYVDGKLVASEANYYYIASTITNSSYVKALQWQITGYGTGSSNGFAYYFDNLAFTNNLGEFIK